MNEPSENTKQAIKALTALMQDKRGKAAVQTFVGTPILLTLYLFAQDVFHWWRSPFPPTVDRTLVLTMAVLSLVVCTFNAFFACLYVYYIRRRRRSDIPLSKPLRFVLTPILYLLPALWGWAYLTGSHPRLWAILAVTFAVLENVFVVALMSAERFAELRRQRGGASGSTGEIVAAALGRVGKLLASRFRFFLWRRWWQMTHIGYLRRMRPLDRALALAIARSDVRSTEAYLTRGADPNLRLRLDVPLLAFALARTHASHLGVARALLEAGANPNATRPYTDTTLLISLTAKGDAAAVRLLLEHGAATDARTRQGVTALMMAALLGHREIVRALLDAGADATGKDAKGVTALDYARRKKHAALVATLEAAQACSSANP